MKKIHSSKKLGFSLPEVLVTLAIIAALSAVIIPALNSNLFKGDTGRFASDMVNIQTAIQQFVADVKRYPSKMTDLTGPIGTTADINGTTYSSGSIAKWKGPYITSNLATSTAYDGTIANAFSKVDADASTATVNYVVVSITGVDATDFARVDSLIDSGTGIGSSTGNLRWATVSSTVTYYAVPIQ